MENYEDIIEQQIIAGQVGQQAQQNAAAQYYLEETQKSLAETQLEVDSIISKVYHLLKQDVLRPDTNGKVDWHPLVDKKKLVFTDEGVDKIMQIIGFYVNKNTLLSNFDVEQINRLMATFLRALTGLIFMKYEIIFRQPTIEECIEILKARNTERAKIIVFAGDILGKSLIQKTVEEDLLIETQSQIEIEIRKIRGESRKEKIRECWAVMAELEIIVYSTLNRAFRGEERGSIRRHQNISEIIGGRPSQLPKAQQGGIGKWF